MIAVGGGSALAGSSLTVPPLSGRGSVRLLPDANGRRRRVTYAQIARTNPWVMACINDRGGLASRVPIHVFRPDPAGRPGFRERVRPGDSGPGGDVADLLAEPEPRLSGRRFRRRTAGDLLTHGNALIELLWSGSRIVGLQWQPWVDVDPQPDDSGLRVEAWKVPKERVLDGLGWRRVYDTRVIDAASAIHLTIGDDVEGPLGVSPLASLHATHALHEAAWRFAERYLENGMFPSGVVELPHQATVAQAMVTRELLEELHAGPDNAGRPGVIGFGTWKQITASPEGAKLVELAKLSVEEVGAAYRMPWIGHTSEMNRATAEVQRRTFVRDVVGEDVSVFETELNVQLVAQRPRLVSAGVFVEAELGELLRPDMEALAKIINLQVGAPVMTPNDGRRLLNLPPHPSPAADELILNPGTPGAGDRDTPEDDQDDA